MLYYYKLKFTGVGQSDFRIIHGCKLWELNLSHFQTRIIMHDIIFIIVTVTYLKLTIVLL